MTDRKPIMCGGVELKWVETDQIWLSENVTPAMLRVAVMQQYRGGFWLTIWGADGYEKSYPTRPTPEAAASDLAEFLGELHEATRVFKKVSE